MLNLVRKIVGKKLQKNIIAQVNCSKEKKLIKVAFNI